jgi:hypothetical protein
MCLCPLGQQRRNPRSLLGRQLGWAAEMRAAAQPLDALLAGALDPLADRGSAHAQGSGDVFLPPALLM